MNSMPQFRSGRLRVGAAVFLFSITLWRTSSAANFYQGVVTNNLPWPGGIVPYVFDTNISSAQQAVYLDGMREWELAANVHFVPRTNQSHYVILRFDYQQGTNTYVGSTPPVLKVDTLSRAQVGHETGHLLGFQHEQVRLDRTNYITIHFANLQTNGTGEQDPNVTGLYAIDTNSTPNGPYDFESVMHYGRTLFSIDPNTLDVIVPNPPYLLKYYYRIGNLALSPGDRAGAAYLYGPPATPLTNIVTTAADAGAGSLRAAIYYANDHPGTTVRFGISTNDPGYSNGVYTIYLSGELPPLVTDGTVIDATTQPGFVDHPVIALSGAHLIPELAYTDVLFTSGLHLYAANCEVRGLAVNHFPYTGIYVQYAFAQSNRIDGCYVGLEPHGTNADANSYEGIQIALGASHNFIGGTNASQRNVISGNNDYGLLITGTNTLANTVLGNFIGLNAAGTGMISNRFSGIGIWGGSISNVIGGVATGSRNVISGNHYYGVYVSDANTVGTVFQGNYVGVDAGGSNAVPNGAGGIGVFNGAHHVTVGGTNPAARNVLSGNADAGLWLSGAGVCSNVVQGNYIGLNAAGTAAVSNGWTGIYVTAGSGSNLIGGTATGAANVLSGNFSEGLHIADPGTSNNVIQGNFVGTGPQGTNAFPNGFAGIGVWNGAVNTVIGGTNAAARNLISGNAGQGIVIGDAETSGTLVLGNYIGLATDGITALRNDGIGVLIETGSQSNTIGGTLSGAGNVIAANGGDAIQIYNSSHNLIQGNFVGTVRTGLSAAGNSGTGVSLFGGSAFNTIGGTAAAARNLISASTDGNGLYLADSGTSNNVIQGNYIGTDASGSAPLGNQFVGVFIGGGAQNNFIGGTGAGAGNVISANAGDGIQLYGDGTSNNLVQGNFVGTDKTGSHRLGNGGSALSIISGPQFTTIGGATVAARNLFSASTNYDGVYLYGAANNVIQGNYIGTDISGLVAFPNGAEGVAVFGGSQNNQIGGPAAGAGNVVAASTYRGVFIADPGTTGNRIQGNNIGVGADGTNALANGFEGVAIANGASNNIIGLNTDGGGAGNRIAFNNFSGIYVGYYNEGDTRGNTIRGNSIFANGYLGIDLSGGTENSLVTVNDGGDSDTGPNDLQNHPVITKASAAAGTTTIGGTLNGTPGRGFLIDVYYNTNPDAAGYGEGQVYAGNTSLGTDGSGNGTFTLIITGGFAGKYFVATATDAATGNTSEFGPDVLATNGPAPPSFTGSCHLTGTGFVAQVSLTVGESYHFQTTTNLAASPIPWINLTNFTAAAPSFQFIDRTATNYPMRFYRVVSP
jgi:hypothetical protein